VCHWILFCNGIKLGKQCHHEQMRTSKMNLSCLFKVFKVVAHESLVGHAFTWVYNMLRNDNLAHMDITR